MQSGANPSSSLARRIGQNCAGAGGSRAKSMLREGVCITQIAHGVGFADHSHLDRSFRVLLGMTPTQYRDTVEL